VHLNLTPEKRKEKTLAALTAQVEGLSAREPVLMVYEDLRWSDPTTRESLDLLVDHLSGRRILAIMTFRPEFSPQWTGGPTCDNAYAQPTGAAATRGDDRACDGRENTPQGDFEPNR
jgi:predicted ATPase